MNRDEIIRMAREAGLPAFLYPDLIAETDWKLIERFAALVAAAEREACAKVCDDLSDNYEKMDQWGSYQTAEALSQAIRTRGQA